MGQALENSGVSLAAHNLRRCTGYSSTFKDHKPGHILAAQDLANVFYRRPGLLGLKVKRHIKNGSVNANQTSSFSKKGMIFIMNGWGNTDHIDVWDGVLQRMKGSPDTDAYRKVGRQVWFWEMA